jgi:hypothetical protein
VLAVLAVLAVLVLKEHDRLARLVRARVRVRVSRPAAPGTPVIGGLQRVPVLEGHLEVLEP